jgi:tetratricopeptide (TPR) repeat protein
MTRPTAPTHRFQVFLILFWLLIFSSLAALRLDAQSNYWPDSLKRELAKATDWKEKTRWSAALAIYYFGSDSALSESYGRQALEAAEMSRDRMLMIKAYLRNGERYLQSGGLAGSLGRAMENARRAEQIARDEKLDAGLIDSYCLISRIFRIMGNNEQALSYSNQAVSMAADGGDDSLQLKAYISLGDTYDRMNEKLLAFRNYLKALDVAEQSKKDQLIKDACESLTGFYAGIHEYDKAIDYELKVMALERKLGARYELTSAYNYVAALFSQKKEYDLALQMFEHSMELADSIHFTLIKLNSYFGIFQMYFDGNQFKKGMAYLDLHPEMMKFIDHAGLRFFIDQYYGNAYAETGQFDSAAYYFNKEEPQVESRGGAFVKAGFYDQAGSFYRKKGDATRAISYYLKERAVGQATGNLNILRDCSLSLDSLYLQKGDYRSAYNYHIEYVHDADSLRSLAKETDLLKLEVDNDNRQRERQAKDDELSRERRHNVQYMGFTAGLVFLFISLVMMGWLAVPPSVIRALGFLSFIFLFEFIILLADKTIQAWTHEEPWKVLLIKIGLAAVLVPLHHWLEHKVIHYLSHRKRFGASGPAAGRGGVAALVAE